MRLIPRALVGYLSVLQVCLLLSMTVDVRGQGPVLLRTVTIPDGTLLELELQKNVSSKTAEVGDLVDFAVVSAVVIDDVVVIKKGASARGRVVEVKRGRSFGRAGKLDIAIQDVLATDNERIPLRASEAAEGEGSTGKVTGAIIVTTILFFPVAPLWGFVKGKNVELPIGTRVQSFVHKDYPLQVQANQELSEQLTETIISEEPTPLGSISILASRSEVKDATTNILTWRGYTAERSEENLLSFRTQAGDQLIELEVRFTEVGAQEIKLDAFLFKVTEIPAVGDMREPLITSSGELMNTLEAIKQSVEAVQ